MRGATGRAPPTGGRCSRRSSAKRSRGLPARTAEDLDDLVPLSCRAAYDAAYHNWLGADPDLMAVPPGQRGPSSALVPLRIRGGAGAAHLPRSPSRSPSRARFERATLSRRRPARIASGGRRRPDDDQSVASAAAASVASAATSAAATAATRIDAQFAADAHRARGGRATRGTSATPSCTARRRRRRTAAGSTRRGPGA